MTKLKRSVSLSWRTLDQTATVSGQKRESHERLFIRGYEAERAT